MHQFYVLNRLKAIKKTSSGLIGSFNIEKVESSFFYKTFLLFFAFFNHLETSHFSYPSSVNYKPLLQPNEYQ